MDSLTRVPGSPDSSMPDPGRRAAVERSHADPETRAAVALTGIEGLGHARICPLVDRYGSALAVLRRGSIDPETAARLRLSSGVRRKIVSTRPAPVERLSALSRRGIRVIPYRAEAYPERLYHLHQPPAILYLRGPRALPERRAVAVVGTRGATEYGRRMTRDICGGLAADGWCVVSGMARGIDGAAHRAALDMDGWTVGVLGSGLAHEYPAVNRRLYAAMRERGLLASEFAPEEPPAPGLFPRRNRIIAALADAVLVVQAPRRSGALITARHALELGRDVMAVPGPVGPDASVGVHGLLRDGAGVVTCAEDVLRILEGESRVDRRAKDGELGALRGREAGPRDGGERGESSSEAEAMPPEPGSAHPAVTVIRECLREGPREADALAAAAGLSPGASLSLLTRLELEGLLRSLPGNRFELRGTP